MANSSQAVRILPEIERTLAFGSISGTYAVVGTPLAHSSLLLIFKNGTDKAVTFSWDGTNDHITVLSNETVLLDIQSDAGISETLQAAQGTQFWVKQTAALGSGSVYIDSFYGAIFNSL